MLCDIPRRVRIRAAISCRDSIAVGSRGGGVPRVFLRAPTSYVPRAGGSVRLRDSDLLAPYFGAIGVDAMRFFPNAGVRGRPLAPAKSIAPAGVFQIRRYLTVGVAIDGGRGREYSDLRYKYLPDGRYPRISRAICRNRATISNDTRKGATSRFDGPITRPTGAVPIGGRSILWRLGKSNSPPTK